MKISVLKLSVIQTAAFKAARELPARIAPEAGLFDNLNPGPASLALEATMMAARLYHNQRWSDDDDNLLRSMCESGKSLTLITANSNDL